MTATYTKATLVAESIRLAQHNDLRGSEELLQLVCYLNGEERPVPETAWALAISTCVAEARREKGQARVLMTDVYEFETVLRMRLCAGREAMKRS